MGEEAQRHLLLERASRRRQSLELTPFGFELTYIHSLAHSFSHSLTHSFSYSFDILASELARQTGSSAFKSLVYLAGWQADRQVASVRKSAAPAAT